MIRGGTTEHVIGWFLGVGDIGFYKWPFMYRVKMVWTFCVSVTKDLDGCLINLREFLLPRRNLVTYLYIYESYNRPLHSVRCDF